jgi:tetratricopeptide (TPR) repeat protein
LKDFERALKSFHHALKVGRVALGSVHSEVAITLNKLGNLYYETGDLKSALTAYHQGLEVELAVLEASNCNIWVTVSVSEQILMRAMS